MSRSSTQPESVVISGLGAVGALGAGRAAWAEALAAAVPRWREIDRGEGFHRPGSVVLAGRAEGCDLSPWLSAGAARRMSPPSKLATAAARMAVEDAGGETGADHPPTAVVMATSYGPSSFTESILRQIFLEGGPQTVSPALFTESVANAAAAQVAIACHARGANLTVTQREAGGLIALGLGMRELRLGRARRVLVGAVDEVTPLLHAVLDRMGVLAGSRRPAAARRGNEHAETARPFDRRRDGFLVAEGAAALWLESEADARRRGARVLARVRATASAFDPETPRTGYASDPARLAAALARAFERWGLAPEEVDAIVSCASGSRAGDRLEALVLRRVWGERALPTVFAPKATTGEQLAGALVAAVLAAAGAPFGATPGFGEVDPELGVVPHDGRPLAAPRRVLATALAPGGAAAWALLEQGEP